jgi:hypothetical protein
LIPGYPSADTPVETLVETLHGLLISPEDVAESLPFELRRSVLPHLFEFRNGVKRDQEFRNAPVTQKSWKFSFPFLTHEYFTYCMEELRDLEQIEVI